MEDKLNIILPLFTKKELVAGARAFTKEIDNALSGKPSCFPLILNPVAPKRPKAGFGVALSVGGTNGYVSAFRVSSSGSLTFLNRKFFTMPLKATKETLLTLLAKNCFAAAGDRKEPFSIGVSLAYALTPLLRDDRIDGKLVVFTKEREYEGLLGKAFGEELERFIQTKYKKTCPVSVVNDTIGLLLGGTDARLAGIVGTGMNFAYWETVKNIQSKKLQSSISTYDGKFVGINLEAANFNKFPLSVLGKEIDRKSNIPGDAIAEKEAAGAYLYQLFNVGIKKLNLSTHPNLTTTDQINDIVSGGFSYPSKTSAEDKLVGNLLADRLFNRSAQLVAIELCGVIGKLHIKSGSVSVVMDGSLFWKAKNYTNRVIGYTNDILPGVFPSFTRLFGSSRRGIAMLASS